MCQVSTHTKYRACNVLHTPPHHPPNPTPPHPTQVFLAGLEATQAPDCIVEVKVGALRCLTRVLTNPCPAAYYVTLRLCSPKPTPFARPGPGQDKQRRQQVQGGRHR